MQQQRTISLLDCDVWWKVDFIQWPVTTSSVVGWRRSSKVLPKAKLVPKKKRSWSLFGGLLPVSSTTVFWILMTWLHLRSMLSKSTRCTENFNIYSCLLSIERAQFITQFPITHHTTKPWKVEWTGLQVLLLSLYSPDFSQTDYHFFKHPSFLKWKCFHN